MLETRFSSLVPDDVGVVGVGGVDGVDGDNGVDGDVGDVGDVAVNSDVGDSSCGTFGLCYLKLGTWSQDWSRLKGVSQRREDFAPPRLLAV
jgi:hypothetical protein